MWKKFFLRRLPEQVDDTHIKHLEEFDNIWKLHLEELNSIWTRLDLDKRKEFFNFFLNELQKESPKELSEISPQSTQRAISQILPRSIYFSFLAGYMVGKGWISVEQLSDVNLRLGDDLAAEVRKVVKNSKSRGIAFASAFANISAQTHIAVIEGKFEPINSLEEIEDKIDDNMKKDTPPKAKVLDEMFYLEGMFGKILKARGKGFTLAEVNLMSRKTNPLYEGWTTRVFRVADVDSIEEVDRWLNHPRINCLSPDIFLLGAAMQTTMPVLMAEKLLRILLQDQFDDYYEKAEHIVRAKPQ
jgi:hypothetical protein